jgi:eukaryotic-like serine/threonine-protein kinase
MAAPLPVSTSQFESPAVSQSHAGRLALLERILSNPQLPSPPTLALRLVEKTNDPACKVLEISDLLAQDPALCGKLLKTLNSSLYSFSQPITSLQRAVSILGMKPLRSLILGLTLPAMQARTDPDEGLRTYWKDSVGGAIVARELAKRLRSASPEDDLVASLLRDLGVLLLHQNFPTLYLPVWNGTLAPHADQCAWEERNLGIDHAEVSAALLQSWGMPDEIVEPVRYHHHPVEASALPPALEARAHLLEFAGRVARLERTVHNREFLETTLRIAKERFGLTRPDLESFLADIRSKIEDFASLLRVDIGTCPRFAEVLAAGCEELIRLSAEVSSGSGMHRIARSPGRSAIPNSPDGTGSFSDMIGTSNGNITLSGQTGEFLEQIRELGPLARIHQYRIEKIVGHGSMGIVLKAYDPALDRHVALKVMAPELADSPVAHQRFALEARFAAAIRHENVVSIFAVSDVDGVPFLVMEYVDGTSLQDLLDLGKPFSLKQVSRFAVQMAEGLSAAHRLRLIHRDIKPANILLEAETERVRLTDFGLARTMDRDLNLSQKGLLMGTPLFMSPEQVDGKPLTCASDLFSLGSVLYVLCTGRLPFEYESLSALLHAVVTKEPVPVRQLNAQVPNWLAQTIERLHAKLPEDRFPSAAALADHCKRSIG